MTRTFTDSIITLTNKTGISLIKARGYTIIQIELGHDDNYIVEYLKSGIEKNENGNDSCQSYKDSYTEKRCNTSVSENGIRQIDCRKCCCESQEHPIVPNNCCDR